MPSEIVQLQQNFQHLQKLVEIVNNTIAPIRTNIYNYLNDKHNNKLNASIDYITQDDGIRFQQQKVFDVFKRILYYFENIQFDYKDEFWQRIQKITNVDFDLLSDEQKGQVYKNIFHLILDYQVRIIQQQKLLFKQKEQAQRVKRIQHAKEQAQKKKEQKQKQEQLKQKEQEAQLLQAYQKMSAILQQQFDKMINKISKSKDKVAYAISKQRRIEKERDKKIGNHKTSSFGISHPRKPSKPKKPRTGRKY